MQWWHRLRLCFALRFYFTLAYYVLPQIAFTFGSCFGTSLYLAYLWFVFAGSCFALRFPSPAYGLFLLARALHFAFLSLLMICFCWLVLCTSPLVDFPLVSPCRSKKALAFLDCRAVALSDRNFKSSFVQAQQLLSFLSGTACSLRTLYPLTVSFTTLILSQHHLLQLPFHFNTTLISFSI